MRTPEYLSPSGMGLFYQDADKFYTQYLCDKPSTREPQNHHMSIGSSFDAYVKSYLYKKLVGKPNAEYEFEYMFEHQVESQHRDKARIDGAALFEHYKKIGALADLLLDMQDTVGEPRFETKISGVISRSASVKGVTILGKPDIYFMTQHGARIIFDWKVNGFYSQNGVSPKAGYYRLFPSRQPHPKALPGYHKKFGINLARTLEQIDVSWATQLTSYAWILGCDIGEQFITVIDQYACDPIGGNHRVARHSSLVSPEFQNKVYDKYVTCWNAIMDNHIFINMSLEESRARCRTLDTLMQGAVASGDDAELFARLTDTGTKRWR